MKDYSMKFIKAITDSKYFTSGKLYPILDRIDGGYLTADNDNKEHYVSIEYAIDHFEEVTKQ